MVTRQSKLDLLLAIVIGLAVSAAAYFCIWLIYLRGTL